MKDCYFCKKCGVRVMNRTRDQEGHERGTLAIKGGLVEGMDWSDAFHIFTRSAVAPSLIPKDAQQYEGLPP